MCMQHDWSDRFHCVIVINIINGVYQVIMHAQPMLSVRVCTNLRTFFFCKGNS